MMSMTEMRIGITDLMTKIDMILTTMNNRLGSRPFAWTLMPAADKRQTTHPPLLTQMKI